MAGQHIVMLPFMAQGHLIPFLALAKLIVSKNPQYTITLINTPLNIRNLRPSLPPDSNIHLISLPFNSSDHRLPPDSDNTDSLPPHLIVHLMQASETLQPHFERLIADFTNNDGRPPLAIISDVFLGWTVAVAAKLGIFHATFTTCGAYGTAAYMSIWLNLPHTGTDEPEFGVPGFPESFRLQRSQLSTYMRSADGSDPCSVFFRRQIILSLGSNALLCNTVEELESLGLRLLAGITRVRRMWSIGPLLPLESRTSYWRSGKKPGIEPEACVEWLDSHRPESVVYVSFGSQNTISASQMMELAIGLERSCKPFIWVIRPPIGFDMNEDFNDDWLPEGFGVRMRETMQGMLVKQWAPQLEILSHESTGSFVSHCGWNSVLESLSRGVPIIGWPLASEQFYNSKMVVEELGVGVEIARGVEDGIEHGEVERVIGLVMGDGRRGREMKGRAVRCGEMIRAAMRDDGGDEKGSSIRALQGFIETAVAYADVVKPKSQPSNAITIDRTVVYTDMMKHKSQPSDQFTAEG